MRVRTHTITLVLTLCSSIAQGYQEPTHRRLTETAYDRSALQTSGGALQDLGLNSGSKFPNSSGASKTIQELLSDGAEFEDQSVRSLRHFYNPITGYGLFIPGVRTEMSSPNWALALPRTVFGQERSYWDAREAFLRSTG